MEVGTKYHRKKRNEISGKRTIFDRAKKNCTIARVRTTAHKLGVAPDASRRAVPLGHEFFFSLAAPLYLPSVPTFAVALNVVYHCVHTGIQPC